MKKLSRSQKIKVIDVLKDFENNPFQRRLNNHALYGAWQGFRSINVGGDLRIIFRDFGDNTYEVIELITIGSHSQLYG